MTRFGRFARAVDPGLVRINPLSEDLIKVDVKIQIVGMFKSIWLTIFVQRLILPLQRSRSRAA